jgi:hypothetical protein
MKLSEDEREVLLEEVAQAVEHVRAPEGKVRYGELSTAVDQGDIPDVLLDPLETLLEVALESGRIRKLHKAHGEMAALRVWWRTPKGGAIRETTTAVNEALEAIAGAELHEARLSPSGPGAYSLTLATDKGQVLIHLSRQGAKVQSVEVG